MQVLQGDPSASVSVLKMFLIIFSELKNSLDINTLIASVQELGRVDIFNLDLRNIY